LILPPDTVLWYDSDCLIFSHVAADQPVPPVAPAPGEVRPVVPDHEVLRRIGRGSYGEIWLARALATGTWRAVKIVWRRNFESERSFRREFEGMTAFEPISRSHAGFVDILQVGRNDALGFFYYVMELADDQATGQAIVNPAAYTPRTLRAVLQVRQRLLTPECLALGASLSEALGALHAHGLSHRDIKPDNIIFVGGEAKLADIGLVAAHGQRSYVGTEGYVPPEGPGSASADLYSLGKVLYEAGMGKDRLEFPAIASDLEALGPDHGPLLRSFNQLLLRACDPRPGHRYASAQEMEADLRRLREGKTLRGKPRRIAGWAGLAVVAGLLLLAALFGSRGRGRWHGAAAPAVAATLTHSPSRAATISEPPRTGSARLETDPPGALVSLGDREVGNTPLDLAGLPPGAAEFTFVLSGFRRQTKLVTIAAGRTGALHLVLAPSRAPKPDAPWENSLGMRFLPLDEAVHMSVWKTRVRDFAAFAQASGYDATGGMASFKNGGDALLGASWREPGFAQSPDHPVVGINWKDAYAFCDWLTEREHQSGDLEEAQFYRLPTDLEWSRAVGLPPETGATPQSRSSQIKDVYPWGTQFPPPAGAGNYAGAELRAPGVDWPANLPTIPGGFADGFPRTSPVGSFAPNRLGFYDLGGNAWEWCEDRFAPGGETRVLRGASWGNVRADLLLSSKRIDAFPNTRSDLYGFRVVLETPAFGQVEITSEPAGATIFQDDRVLGQTPMTLKSVPFGAVAYTLKLDGYQPMPLAGQVASSARLALRGALVSVQGPQAGQPWENALGMRFVPVGQSLLFSVWTTRVADFEVFCRETGRTAPSVDFVQGPEHPAVNVNRHDAEAFCTWLTARELGAGRLQVGQCYRLPTDAEWSRAAGLTDEQGETPEARDGRVRGVYPWGKAWPPPPGAGNFAASEVAAGGKHARRRVTPRGEPYAQTAPVGSFTPNSAGLYDMAGNVWQWCADDYKKSGALRNWGVLRGGSWADYGPSILQTSYRNVVPSGERDVIYGFRCVIDLHCARK
jgi:formylglycine-generating enzyme required for sulfatase activity